MRISLPFLLFFAWLGFTGCREHSTADYEIIETQLVHELFTHLASGEGETALRLLDKLGRINPDNPFYAGARQRELLRRTLIGLSELLMAGDVEAARILFDQHRRLLTKHPEFAETGLWLSAFEALHKYKASSPFVDPVKMAAALDELQPHAELLGKSGVYRNWQKAEQEKLRRLKYSADESALKRMIMEFDRMAVTEPAKAGILLNKITVAASENEAGKDVAEFLNNGVRSDVPVAMKMVADAAGLMSVRLGKPSPSVSAALLSAFRDAQEGHWQQAIAGLAEVQKTSPVAPQTVVPFLSALLPEEQFQARPWQSPFPTVTDVLNRMAQLQEHIAKKQH